MVDAYTERRKRRVQFFSLPLETRLGIGDALGVTSSSLDIWLALVRLVEEGSLQWDQLDDVEAISLPTKEEVATPEPAETAETAPA